MVNGSGWQETTPPEAPPPPAGLRVFRDRKPRLETTWQHVAVLGLLVVLLVGLAWACAWGVRG